jgi:hypothetical protein
LVISSLPARTLAIVAETLVPASIVGVPESVRVSAVTVYPSTAKVSPAAVIASPRVTVPAIPSKMAESGGSLLQVASLYGPPWVEPQVLGVVSHVPVSDQ